MKLSAVLLHGALSSSLTWSALAGEALYDLADDRHEDRDVQAGHPDVLRELRAIAAREHRDAAPVPVPVAYDRGGRRR